MRINIPEELGNVDINEIGKIQDIELVCDYLESFVRVDLNFDNSKIGTFKVDLSKTLSSLGKLTEEEIEDIKNLWGEI